METFEIKITMNLFCYETPLPERITVKVYVQVLLKFILKPLVPNKTLIINKMFMKVSVFLNCFLAFRETLVIKFSIHVTFKWV